MERKKTRKGFKVWTKGLYPDGGYIVSTESLGFGDKSIHKHRNSY